MTARASAPRRVCIHLSAHGLRSSAKCWPPNRARLCNTTVPQARRQQHEALLASAARSHDEVTTVKMARPSTCLARSCLPPLARSSAPLRGCMARLVVKRQHAQQRQPAPARCTPSQHPRWHAAGRQKQGVVLRDQVGHRQDWKQRLRQLLGCLDFMQHQQLHRRASGLRILRLACACPAALSCYSSSRGSAGGSLQIGLCPPLTSHEQQQHILPLRLPGARLTVDLAVRRRPAQCALVWYRDLAAVAHKICCKQRVRFRISNALSAAGALCCKLCAACTAADVVATLVRVHAQDRSECTSFVTSTSAASHSDSVQWPFLLRRG